MKKCILILVLSLVLIVSVVLVSILYCPMAMAAPSIPNDVQIVQPDPSLPKELSDFWGKWEWNDGRRETFIIVEKIDEQKASLYIWRDGFREIGSGWTRYEGNVIKERGKYIIWYPSPYGISELTLKGEYLEAASRGVSARYRRVQ